MCLWLAYTCWVCSLMFGTFTWFLWDQNSAWLLNSIVGKCFQDASRVLSFIRISGWLQFRYKEQKVFICLIHRTFEEQHWLLRNSSNIFLGKQLFCWELTLLFQPGCLPRKKQYLFCFLMQWWCADFSSPLSVKSYLLMRLPKARGEARMALWLSWESWFDSGNLKKRSKRRLSIFTVALKLAAICLGNTFVSWFLHISLWLEGS